MKTYITLSKDTLTYLALLGVGLGIGFFLPYVDFYSSENVTSVILSEDVLQKLLAYFEEYYPREYGACLYGYYDEEKNAYVIEDVLKAPGKFEERYARFLCPRGALGTIHSHPHGPCRFSNTDWFTFGVRYKAYGMGLAGLHCEDGILFYHVAQGSPEPLGWIDTSGY